MIKKFPILIIAVLTLYLLPQLKMSVEEELNFAYDHSTNHQEASGGKSTICNEQSCAKAALTQKNTYSILKKALVINFFLAFILMIIISPQNLYSTNKKTRSFNHLQAIHTTIFRE